MKLLATTAAVSLFAFAAHANTINGCEVELIEGTNAYQFVDPTCPPFNGGGASSPSYAQPAEAAAPMVALAEEQRAAVQKAAAEHSRDSINSINGLRH